MREGMKQKVFYLLLCFVFLFVVGCTNNKNDTNTYESDETSTITATSELITADSESFVISKEEVTQLILGETLNLKSRYNNERITWTSDNEDILQIVNNVATAKSIGNVVLTATFASGSLEYYINVNNTVEYIKVSGKQNLNISEETKLVATVYPETVSQEVIWTSFNPDMVSIDEEGNVAGLASGMAKIQAVSKVNEDIITYYYLLVEEEEIINITIGDITNTTVDLNNYDTLLSNLIVECRQSVIGVSNYTKNKAGQIILSSAGSGVIYKRFVVYKDESIALDDGSITYDDIDHFLYYVITNKHIIIDNYLLKIYYGDDDIDINANLIQYDSKVDLAVISFESDLYFKTAKIGDSSEVETGDFIIAIGNSEGYDYYQTATFGVVSSAQRYVSVDTDEDGVSDWDAEYLQIDAPVNEGNSGGAVFNLKGEVVGISSTKISSLKIENMGFAIPTNLTMEIVEILETGEQPQRPLIGIMMLLIKDYIANRDYYEKFFPEYNVPSDITYGVYVTEVTANGIGDKGGLKVNDIVLTFNGKEIRNSYVVRLELNTYVTGSGSTAELLVYRNGEYITLTLTF